MAEGFIPLPGLKAPEELFNVLQKNKPAQLNETAYFFIN